jgi:hypothetical protein
LVADINRGGWERAGLVSGAHLVISLMGYHGSRELRGRWWHYRKIQMTTEDRAVGHIDITAAISEESVVHLLSRLFRASLSGLKDPRGGSGREIHAHVGRQTTSLR